IGYSWVSAPRPASGTRPVANTVAPMATRPQADETEQQRLAALKAEQQRQAKFAADAEAKRNEEQRLATLRPEDERRAKGGDEANATVTKRIKRDVSLGYLNLRSGPGQDQKVLARIPAGSTGVVMRGRCVAPKDNTSSYQFCLVEWNGYEGWVSSNGLE